MKHKHLESSVFLLGLSLFTACGTESSTSAQSDAGTLVMVTDAATIALPKTEDPCATLFHGDPVGVVPSWDAISCVGTSTNPCNLFGLQSRQYKVCSSISGCQDRCSCGLDGKNCKARTVTDTAPCMRQAPAQPLEAEPWGTCEASDQCSMSGTQSRLTVICEGTKTATALESATCQRTVDTSALVVGEWEECTYADTCIETGTSTRTIEACVNEITVLQSEAQTCTRSTESIRVATLNSSAACSPVAFTDCSPNGTRTTLFTECVGGLETQVAATDSRTTEVCELPRTQTTDLSVSNASTTLEEVQSQVEIARSISAALSPTPAYDGSTFQFQYDVPDISASTPLSPKSLNFILWPTQLELNDENGDGLLVSPDGMNTGTVDYQTGRITVTFADAPVTTATTSVTGSGPRNLSVESSYAASSLALCRLSVVHGNLSLDLSDTVSQVSIEQLTEVYGDLSLKQVSSTAQTSYEFSALERIRGNLTLDGSYLSNISMPVLQAIDGHLIVSGSGGSSLTMSQLASLKSIIVGTSTLGSTANANLVRFDLPSLQTVNANFLVADNPQLTAWSVDVQKVYGDLTITQTNTSSCTLFNTYVAPIQGRQGIDGTITVTGLGGTLTVAAGATYPDTDGDGFIDVCDNCPTTFNANQTDSDGDNLGDECDPTPNG